MSDINNLRNKMDAVTLEMINLLKTRTDIAKEIGEVKKNIGKGAAYVSTAKKIHTDHSSI